MTEIGNKDLARQPKYVQRYIRELREENDRLRNAHAVLFDYAGWFTLGVGTQQPTKLFTCSSEGTHCIATIGNGDILLVGRSKQVIP
jgi:hypothetical protein